MKTYNRVRRCMAYCKSLYVIASKSSPEPDDLFEMNNAAWAISVSGDGSIHDITPEQC
jgi:hypothetical protein